MRPQIPQGFDSQSYWRKTQKLKDMEEVLDFEL